MSIVALVLLAVIALIVVYGILVYNSLVTVKHNISKAWANIDVLLPTERLVAFPAPPPVNDSAPSPPLPT